MPTCYQEIDWGLLEPWRAFDARKGKQQVVLHTPNAIVPRMEYTFWPARTLITTKGVRSVRPLSGVAQDGARHDPRYLLEEARFSSYTSTRDCNITFAHNTLLVPRKDDHNPFFMLNLLLSLWVMNTTADTQILFLDDAGPSATDSAFQRLVTPGIPLLYADEFVGEEGGGNWCFEQGLWTVPFASSLSSAFSVPPPATRPGLRITFIGRRNYNKRQLQRVWKQEAETVRALQQAYPACAFQLVYLEKHSFREQLATARSTDVMVGMHGAGLVFSLFMQPGRYLVEIFPRRKRRWGYRNIAQHRGLHHIEYRKGADGARESKDLPTEQWLSFWKTQPFSQC